MRRHFHGAVAEPQAAAKLPKLHFRPARTESLLEAQEQGLAAGLRLFPAQTIQHEIQQ